MAQRNWHHPQPPNGHPFQRTCHSPAPVNKLEPSQSQPESLKRRKLKAVKHRGGNKYNWSSGHHYLPASCTLSTSNSLSNSSSPPAPHRWSKIACFEKQASMPPLSKTTNQSNTLKCQARKVLRRIFSVHKSFSSSSANLNASQSSQLSHAKPNNTSEDALDISKPTISYPMKLHNADLSFVITQDPWEASVRSSSLRRRATIGTRRSEDHTSSRTEHRLSSCQPSITSKRLSFSVHHRASHDLTCNPASQLRRTTLTRPTLTTSDRPNSSNQIKSSFESKRSENYSFPPNRSSHYRHPPVRPLSLSHHSRRNSALLPGEDISKRTTTHDGPSRRSSMISSNVTTTTSQTGQSWTTGRVVLDTSTPQGSAPTCSERSFVSTAATDQKSVSSYRLPAASNWAGVIEEDITLTLMGSPDATHRTQQVSPPAAEFPGTLLRPPFGDPRTSPPLRSSTSLSDSVPSLIIPPQPTSCPTLLPSTPSQQQHLPALVSQLHRPLSLLFQPTPNPSVLPPADSLDAPRSDWYAELMTTVEQTISKIH